MPAGISLGPLRGRVWGAGPALVAVHGGPAAAGSARDLARGLADRHRVYEPWQRPAGQPDGPEDGSAGSAAPLTVERHVADLAGVIAAVGMPRAIIGHSWGAMLALAWAAAHPEPAVPLALIGCGTFDPAARARYRQTLDERTPLDLRATLDALRQRLGHDPAAAAEYQYLAEPLDHVAPLPAEPDPDASGFDPLAHQQTWDDMLRRQEAGDYPAAFAAIRAPVLLLMGDYDPHPGRLIRDSLQAVIPHLEYIELLRCGHEPWRERDAQAPFFAALEEWLARSA